MSYLGAPAAWAGEAVVHDFGGPAKGVNPYATLIRDSAGNLYGTTVNGGQFNQGVVYKITTTGFQRVVHSFSGADGAYPYGGVAADASGNLYGTTSAGGTANKGVVYKLDTSANYNVLYNFTGGADGNDPQAGVVLDALGNLYGTTLIGGASGLGVVFKVDTGGNQTVLYSFAGGADGNGPNAGVILDSSGNLYGTTTLGGGAANAGTVFKIDTTLHETVLYSFLGVPDGANPLAGVIRDSSGNLYGTTLNGGTSNWGEVYKLDTSNKETVLYSFLGGVDGANPYSGVTFGPHGDLYGTTAYGGTAFGVVYKVNAFGEAPLFIFGGSASGIYPYTGLTIDSAGNLYGTTYSGGPTNSGVVYEVNSLGVQTILCDFSDAPDGSNPRSGVVTDATGNYYGTTMNGGFFGAGTIYKLDPAFHETVLYSFTGGADGGNPSASVILDAAGNLYGTTAYGGVSNAGTVFKLDPSLIETVLYSFTGGADGANPYASLITSGCPGSADTCLWGTAENGGTGSVGVVYTVDLSNNSYSVAHTFTGGDGAFPYANLTYACSYFGPNAYCYVFGVTVNGGPSNAGTIFALDASSPPNFYIAYTFSGGLDGGDPYAGLLPAICNRNDVYNFDACLYLTTVAGGSANSGTVFVCDVPWDSATPVCGASGLNDYPFSIVTQTLYSFSGGADGGQPYGGLVMDSTGNLYGTTYSGGTSNAGTVYELDTALAKTLLYTFTGGTDGGHPYSPLIMDSTGKLYGTASSGGKAGGGVVFVAK
jgi:uncharacterized repeat protein (TIGR03803 family)